MNSKLLKLNVCLPFQEVPNYLRGYHNCSEKDAGRLAAYIYRAQFADDMSALADFE